MKVPQKSLIGTATQVNGLYVLDIEKTTSYLTNTSPNGNRWHLRLGHLNIYSLDQLVKYGHQSPTRDRQDKPL